MQVTLQYAQEHLADLVSAATRGEEVEIAQPDASDTRLFLVARVSEAPPLRKSRKELLGAWEGQVQLPTDDEWRAMDDEIAAEMLDGQSVRG